MTSYTVQVCKIHPEGRSNRSITRGGSLIFLRMSIYNKGYPQRRYPYVFKQLWGKGRMLSPAATPFEGGDSLSFDRYSQYRVYHKTYESQVYGGKFVEEVYRERDKMRVPVCSINPYTLCIPPYHPYIHHTPPNILSLQIPHNNNIHATKDIYIYL